MDYYKDLFSSQTKILVVFHSKPKKQRALFKFYILFDNNVRSVTDIIADALAVSRTKQGYIAVDNYVANEKEVAKTILETFAKKLGYENTLDWVQHPVFAE